MTNYIDLPSGTGVSIINSEIYEEQIGTVSKKQDDVAGVFVDISTGDGFPKRRLWFPKSDVKPVKPAKKSKAKA